MDVGWLYRIIALLILLLLSALFSGAEVALFSLDEKRINILKKQSGKISAYVIQLLEYPRKLLVTILIGNTIANVAASILAVSIALDLAEIYSISQDFALLFQIIILTIIVILFAEITPKVWANKHPINFSRVIALPLWIISMILNPISVILSRLILFATSKVKYDKSRTALSTSEIADLADIGVEKGTLEEEEQDLIQSLVEFKTVNVRMVMTPRVDVLAVPIDISFESLVELIKESGHSRIPVYKDDLDDIVGILYAKDLLPYLSNAESSNNFDLKQIIRECIFVPETKLIHQLMQEFQEKNMHLSIVVDEYGGTSGIITLEDILEEIVGEIRDEFDDEEDEIKQLGENKYLISGKISIDELEERLDIKIDDPDEDFETLGGFIFNHAGTIPKENYSFSDYGYTFRVVRLINNRIDTVEVEKNTLNSQQLEKGMNE